MSVAVAEFVKSGTTKIHEEFNAIVCGPSQVGTGGVASSPVNITVQVEEFPLHSVTVIVTV